MPLGSSSEAPVMRPGPNTLRSLGRSGCFTASSRFEPSGAAVSIGFVSVKAAASACLAPSSAQLQAPKTTLVPRTHEGSHDRTSIALSTATALCAQRSDSASTTSRSCTTTFLRQRCAQPMKQAGPQSRSLGNDRDAPTRQLARGDPLMLVTGAARQSLRTHRDLGGHGKFAPADGAGFSLKRHVHRRAVCGLRGPAGFPG